MADVIGTFGDQPVELNNAATEATLKALLSIAKVDSKNLVELAKKAGVDSKNLQEFNESLETGVETLEKGNKLENARILQIDEQLKKYGKINTVIGQLDATMTKLMSGTGKASDIFSALGELPGALGVVASGLAKFAKIQEENFATYQKISASGTTFAGSLTDLRLAAANSYMTLDGFATLMKNNSEQLVQLGGSVIDGSVSFAKFSHSVLKSDLGTHLMALGYTADEANQSMLTYLAASGVSNTKDLESNKALRDGAGQYLEELDRLAEVTGKSREQQDESMKKLQLDAEVQMTAARMPKEERAKFEANVKYMTDMYGEGGKDVALANAQHRAVLTNEGKMLVAMVPEITSGYDKLAKANMGSKQAIDAQNDISLAAQKGFGNIPTAALGLVKGLNQAEITTAKQMQDGLTSREAFNARDKKIADDRAARDKSQADTMAESQKAFKELGAALWEAFSPIISGVTTVIGWLGKFAGSIASVMNEFPMLSKGLAIAGTLLAAYVAWKAKSLAAEKASSVLGGLTGGGGGAAGAAGSAAGGGLGKLLGGIGSGIGGILQGLAAGLTAFADPLILLGAAIFAGSVAIIITGIGASVAAAAYLIGKALPTLSEGLDSFSKIDGKNLTEVAKGIGDLGISLAAFGALSAYGQAGNAIGGLIGGITKFFGGDDLLGTITKTVTELTPVIPNLVALGDGLNNLATGMTAYGKAVATIDIAKATQVKELLKGPSAAEQVANAGAKLFTSAANQITAAVTGSKGEEKTASDLQALNITMKEMLRYIKIASDNTERTYRGVENLGTGVWK